MERVSFLVESTGERINCLLNPESVTVRRVSGVQSHMSLGMWAKSPSPDDPILYRGGGTTELDLELLFDLSVASEPVVYDDVRAYTRPLTALTQNGEVAAGGIPVPICRFVWGKYWNVRGVISAVAERLEHFSSNGSPRRSWMTLSMIRVAEENPTPWSEPYDFRASYGYGGAEQEDTARTVPTGAETVLLPIAHAQVYRYDMAAFKLFGDPTAWRDVVTRMDAIVQGLPQGGDRPELPLGEVAHE